MDILNYTSFFCRFGEFFCGVEGRSLALPKREFPVALQALTLRLSLRKFYSNCLGMNFADYCMNELEF